MGGLTMRGSTCKCPGVVTDTQVAQIDAECGDESANAFIKSGGDVEAYDQVKEDGAVDAGALKLATCFDKKFEEKGYKWDKFEEVTAEQLDEIDAECSPDAMQTFIRRGGSAGEWGAKKKDGAAAKAVDKATVCFDK